MLRPKSFLLTLGLACASPVAGQDGRELFLRHCATCHGETGKGDGPTVVDPQPRDLTSGKLSFGTTPEAMARTIRGGIAPPMPGFEDVLRATEIDALVAHVRSLMPETVEASQLESSMTFGPRPRLARGYLPPRSGAGRPLSHGLVVGLPSRLVLEYRTDDLRLLRTFVGGTGDAFVDRTDWRGRGGSQLLILGEPLDENQERDFGATVQSLEGSVDMRIEYRGSLLADDVLRLSGDVFDGEAPVARYVEDVRAVAVAEGDGLHRRIELHDAQIERSVRLSLAGLRVLNTRRHERQTVRGVEIWYGSEQKDGVSEVVGMRGPRVMKATIRAGVAKVLVPIGDRPFTRVDVLRLRMPSFRIDRIPEYAEAFDR